MVTSSSSRQRAIHKAQQALAQKPVYLDTETTGLDRTDEIIEISIIDDDGATLLESLVRPIKPIPPDATRIHGITNDMVTRAPFWPLLWPNIRSILSGKLVVIYNVDFDLGMIRQMASRYKIQWREDFSTVDLLKVYADYRSEWDPRRRSNRYHSLEKAGQQCRIALPNAHRSTADTLLTRALLHYIAENQENS